MKVVTVDRNQLKTPEMAHAHLAELLSFPSYYGANLDALYDVLTDIQEDTCIRVPRLIIAKTCLGQYGERMVEVLSAAELENKHLEVIYF